MNRPRKCLKGCFVVVVLPLPQVFMFKKIRKAGKTAFGLFIFLLILGLLLPDPMQMPVMGAGPADYHKDSFWYYPWGRSVTHKGVDIFARRGTEIRSAGRGIVVYAGEIEMGGKVVLVLGPGWRLHYYAHLDEIRTSTLSYAGQQTSLGTVGDSGNAKGKQPHLHYSILTLVPYPWRIDGSIQGWKKMFYLNPISYFQ